MGLGTGQHICTVDAGAEETVFFLSLLLHKTYYRTLFGLRREFEWRTSRPGSVWVLDADSLTWLSAGPLDDSRLAQLDLVEAPTQVKWITGVNPVMSNDFQIGPESARQFLRAKPSFSVLAALGVQKMRSPEEIRERWLHDRRTNERLSRSTWP